MNINGFHVIRTADVNVLKWEPYGATGVIRRYRAAVNTCVGPWTTTEGMSLDFLVPSSDPAKSKRRRLPLPDMVFLNPGILADFINTSGIPEIFAQPLSSSVCIVLNTTYEPKFLQILPGAGATALGIPTGIVDMSTVHPPIALMTANAGSPNEYAIYHDMEGLSGDEYQIVSSEAATPKMSPLGYQVSVAVVHGTILQGDGTPAVGIAIRAHTIPPMDPVPNATDPLKDPFTFVRPLDYAPFATQCVTDSAGFFHFVCARERRLWLEVSTTGTGMAFDVPINVTHVDVNMLQEWRRTGMLGNYDRGIGAATANLGGGNSDA